MFPLKAPSKPAADQPEAIDMDADDDFDPFKDGQSGERLLFN